MEISSLGFLTRRQTYPLNFDAFRPNVGCWSTSLNDDPEKRRAEMINFTKNMASLGDHSL
jgi:hypothetical protein